jgi:hypothetical protein
LKEFVIRLISLAESLQGPPRNRHELRFLLQWIHSECLIRWPDTMKRAVYETVLEIDGYQLLEETQTGGVK